MFNKFPINMKLGYHASHEQFSPRDLLKLVVKAEQNGFAHVLCSDHFYPWSIEQGQSGYAWSWLGAALQATNQATFGIVNAPGQRYHPAIIAQAGATLAEMFPERFWITSGSGQRLNENITGTGWPKKAERNARLKECVEIMRDMWDGKTVTRQGLVTVENARLFTLPEKRIEVFGAALSEETAAFLAPWVDGLITISDTLPNVSKIINAFRNNGGQSKPVYLKVQLSYNHSLEQAKTDAYFQWRNNCLDRETLEDLHSPEVFDQLGAQIPKDTVEKKVLISNSVQQYIEWFKEYEALGCEKLFLHNVNRGQDIFIEDFGKHVLPHF